MSGIFDLSGISGSYGSSGISGMSGSSGIFGFYDGYNDNDNDNDDYDYDEYNIRSRNNKPIYVILILILLCCICVCYCSLCNICDEPCIGSSNTYTSYASSIDTEYMEDRMDAQIEQIFKLRMQENNESEKSNGKQIDIEANKDDLQEYISYKWNNDETECSNCFQLLKVTAGSENIQELLFILDCGHAFHCECHNDLISHDFKNCIICRQ